MTLLTRTIAALAAAGLPCCDHKSWGKLPLYAEGDDARVRVYRTPGKPAELAPALAALVAAGLHAQLAHGRITLTPAAPRTRGGGSPRLPKGS